MMLRRRIWLFVSAAGLAVVVLFAAKYYLSSRMVAWSIIAPPEYVDTATTIAELRNQGNYEGAVDYALRSMKGQHQDFIYQMIATTYFMRSVEDKDNSGKWARLGAEYTDRAYVADPSDVVNVFNVGLNYIAAGDDLSEGGCEFYRKAWSTLSSLAPKLEGKNAEAQGRTIQLAPLRKQNEERMEAIRYRLRHCQHSLSSK